MRFEKAISTQFPAAKRFDQISTRSETDFSQELNPNFDIKYRKVTGFQINQKKKYQKEIKRKIQTNMVKRMTEMGDGQMSQKLKEQLESSTLTADTEALEDSFLQNIGVSKECTKNPGPGQYTIKHIDEIFQLKKGDASQGTFGKDQRFKLDRETEEKLSDKALGLKDRIQSDVKVDSVKPRIKGGPIIAKPTETVSNNSKLAKKYEKK